MTDDNITKPTLPKPLSPQQRIIMQHLVDGMDFKEISFLMGLKARTVRHYLYRVREKLGAKTNFQCIAILVGCGEFQTNQDSNRIFDGTTEK